MQKMSFLRRMTYEKRVVNPISANNYDHRACYRWIQNFKVDTMPTWRIYITTIGLKLAEFGSFKLIPWRILENLGTRKLKLANFGDLKLGKYNPSGIYYLKKNK